MRLDPALLAARPASVLLEGLDMTTLLPMRLNWRCLYTSQWKKKKKDEFKQKGDVTKEGSLRDRRDAGMKRSALESITRG